MKGGQCDMQHKARPPARSCSVSREGRVLREHFRRWCSHAVIVPQAKQIKAIATMRSKKSDEAAGGVVARGFGRGCRRRTEM